MDGWTWIFIGGNLGEGGNFDWMQNDKFPTMTKPYEGYHGLSFAEEFGPCIYNESES